MPGTDFTVTEARFRFVARDLIRFPALAGNTLRGALGMHLPPELFRPPAPAGPSGLETPPPPFVLRAWHLNNGRFDRGRKFEVFVHLFSPQQDTLRRIAIAFATLQREGLGGSRGRAVLEEVVTEEKQFDLAAVEPCARVQVLFESPMELKGHPSVTVAPPFGVLLARARDRVSTLRALYQGGAPEADFAGLGRRATEIRLAEGSVQAFAAERTSSRTDQTHLLAGFVGKAAYEGELGDFLPWLRAAEPAGIGRHTVWGFGAFRVATER